MGLSIAQKIIKNHLVSGEMIAGNEIGLKIDQTLTQDATGTMVYLEFEAMGIKRVKTEKSVAYIDHNTLQTGFENADDHRYIASVAKKHGIHFSRPGNGICHQVHLERFSVPGKTLIGSDSHTPTCGGVGMLAMGAGGLDVAIAMGGGTYFINMPSIIKINLTGKLNNYVSAKDIILEVLRILTVKGGNGKVIEYGGEGVKTLSVPERATITNMGAELGATTSIFPSDDTTYEFLKAQGRECDYSSLTADDDVSYERVVDIDLSTLAPLAACPHSPDNIKSIKKIGKIIVDQVCIGSCTNSSLQDLMCVAFMLKGKTVHSDVSLSIAPGSKQVLTMLTENGALKDLIDSGARILESACGPCIGMGQAPNSNGVSLRTFNRNFLGRSGTADGQVYLVSPQVAAISAINGFLSDPTEYMSEKFNFTLPEKFTINDNMIDPPADIADYEELTIKRGPNIKPFPTSEKLTNSIKAEAVLKVGNDITTDHIMPAGAKILPYRSNIPYLSTYCFAVCDAKFSENALKAGSSFVIGGKNYGQGSSREHAALVPLYLGVKAVIVQSFARIHKANLINAGIIPLTFVNEEDYNLIEQTDLLELVSIKDDIQKGSEITLKNITKCMTIKLNLDVSERAKNILLAGGLLNYTKEN